MKVKIYHNKNFLNGRKIRLQQEEIHIWCIRWGEIIDFLKEKAYIMDCQEKEKAAQYRFYEDRMWLEVLSWDNSFNLSSLKRIIIGGALVEKRLIKEMVKQFPCDIHIGYGATEGIIMYNAFNRTAIYRIYC